MKSDKRDLNHKERKGKKTPRGDLRSFRRGRLSSGIHRRPIFAFWTVVVALLISGPSFAHELTVGAEAIEGPYDGIAWTAVGRVEYDVRTAWALIGQGRTILNGPTDIYLSMGAQYKFLQKPSWAVAVALSSHAAFFGEAQIFDTPSLGGGIAFGGRWFPRQGGDLSLTTRVEFAGLRLVHSSLERWQEILFFGIGLSHKL